MKEKVIGKITPTNHYYVVQLEIESSINPIWYSVYAYVGNDLIVLASELQFTNYESAKRYCEYLNKKEKKQ